MTKLIVLSALLLGSTSAFGFGFKTNITGHFTGLRGDSILVLNNGQHWEQNKYFEQHLMWGTAETPIIIDCSSADGCLATIQGIDTKVPVVRIK